MHIKEDLRKFCERLDIAVDETWVAEECMISAAFMTMVEYGSTLPEALKLLAYSIDCFYPDLSERILTHVSAFHATSESIVDDIVHTMETPFTTEDYLYGEDGVQVDTIDVQDVLQLSRKYRSAEGPMVDEASKFTQQEVFDESDVARKFDFEVKEPVLLAGAGDYAGRTHLPFNNATLLDPRLNGRTLCVNTNLSGYNTFISDCAGKSEYGLEDMEYLNSVYERLHFKYPKVRMILKLNLCNLPSLSLKLLRKPRPHNLEVICEVVETEDRSNSWAAGEKLKVISANWKRNRRIRDGIYPAPDFPRDRIAYYYAKAEGTYYKQNRVSLIPSMGLELGLSGSATMLTDLPQRFPENP